jgi:hypothetical protein
MNNLDFYVDRPETDQLLNGLKQASGAITNICQRGHCIHAQVDGSEYQPFN